MPALPLINNVVRSTLYWSDSSDINVTTTLFWRYTGGPPNAAACNALAVDLADAVNVENTLWHEDTTFLGTKITDLSSVSGGVGTATVAQNGLITAPPLAGGTAVVVNYLINRRYRGGKPRSYFPWLSSGSLVNRQQWGSADIGNVLTGVEAIVSAFTGATSGGCTISSHANVSYYEGFTVVTNPVTGRARNVPKLRLSPQVDDIVGTTVLSRPGSQRRRNK